MVSEKRRNNNSERQPWPADAAQTYRNIESLAEEIDRLLTRIWLDGLGGERNLYLIRDLLPIIRKLAAEIVNECDRYTSMKKTQNWPHWPGWGIRDTIEPVASAVIQAVNLAERSYAERPPNLPRVRQMISEALDYPGMIRNGLYQGPPPEGGREPVSIIWRNGLDDLNLEWE